MMPLNTRLISRRAMLRAGGVAIGLPLLDAMVPLGRGAEQPAERLSPRRMVLISRSFGVHAPYLFPEATGRNYVSTRYLRLLDAHRERFTVFSGLSHLGYPNAHHTEPGLFTGVAAEVMQREGDNRNTVSLDILAAEQIGRATRFPYISLNGFYSYNRRGVRVPSESSAAHLFRRLFIDGTREEIARETQRLREGRSILDGVREQAKSLSQTLGSGDRQRLESMLDSIREAEERLLQEEAWVNKPKPRPEYQTREFRSNQLLEAARQWYDLIHLALQTDSTRVIGLHVSHLARPLIDGVTMEHHEASHHGQDPAKLDQLARFEEAEFGILNEFLSKLQATTEGDETLLDRTMVFHGSNLGNASAHTTQNLPIILAGGGFKHAGHVAFDRQQNRPLSNLYVRMLRQLGITADRFGSSTGELDSIG